MAMRIIGDVHGKVDQWDEIVSWCADSICVGVLDYQIIGMNVNGFYFVKDV